MSWTFARGGLAVAGTLVLVACGGGPESAPALRSVTESPEVTVAETWVTERDTTWDVDTPALWRHGTEGLLVVTSKAAHDLKVFDAATGESRPAIGGPGTNPGQFRRPNAVVVVNDFAIVVERDNRRVQVLHLPDGASLGTFGQDQLTKPYGVVASGTPDDLTLWVTDDYDVPAAGPRDLSRRVHRFRVSLADATPPAVLEHRAFGDSDGPGALAVVETIGLDLARGRLFVADEARKSYLVFDTAGVYTGSALALGRITGDPEGMALVACGDSSGWWIVTDQQPDVSWFRVFRRDDLSYVGSFRGAITANTDGVTFADAPVPGFPGAAFFAVHDDQAVSAFDWESVAKALGLQGGCH